MPAPVIILNKPLWARIFTVLWGIEVLAGLGFAAGGFGLLGKGETGVAVVLIIAGLLLTIVGVVMTGISWQAARLTGPAIEMLPEGFRDRRITETVIPWSNLTWKVVFNGRAYSLQFDVDKDVRKTLHVYWAQRAMGVFNRSFNYPELTVLTLGTGKSAHQLGEILARFCSQKL